MYPKLTPQRSWNERRRGSKKTNRMPKRVWTGNIVPVVVSIVGAVSEVKGLGDQLHIQPLADFDVLGQLGVEFENRSAAKRVKLGYRAVVRQIETVLRSNV